MEEMTARLKEQIKTSTGAVESMTEKLQSSEAKTAFLALESDHGALKDKLKSTEGTLSERDALIVQLKAKLEENAALIAELESKIREEEMVRRKLHNTIQELKGNIRVFCRVRPLLGNELQDGKKTEDVITHMKLPDSNSGKEIELMQVQESANGKSVTKTYPFNFDMVFPGSTTQSVIFEEISQLVQSALDGYPVCIFAYGQTGSGKTYTMEGPDNLDESNMGMIPRAVHQIFATAAQLKEKGWEYEMEGQFVEIYNESVHDLLGNARWRDTVMHSGADMRILFWRHTTVILDTPGKVTALLKKASQNRAVAATMCNERSSRSHSVFTLRLKGRNRITLETSEGLLNLIDLAGSERLSASGATGERLKETQAINKSLSSLGDVIAALANKDAHIPYRNSKLTYLLQNSLGGNSKTLMFVNISPLPESFQETLCSLRFATKVNSCHIGTARRVVK
ncbi:P-loop containing nucleoside triphosphate hydrolase protein [Thamnocephalis sphaerospora]|uniref:P-loop containing nucleoside triphosphate hydrolase protein n=1 Tax=Thamnocephalis sphaerospora TaxID=78915 RepID=A0A4P9XX15_9FUNG|nr:P-loop containing nucleoside triphosphate hydrolase protein [Thamnocephalis sphaerospora]|eukprot:RKP10895.1 P-loop containing nucleoside triphosphate hydrolase protein [Thamnocephalis sphaerospora]